MAGQLSSFSALAMAITSGHSFTRPRSCAYPIIMCGTRFQVPQRATIAFALYVPFSSYSIDVGSFCICLARFAQSPKSESIPMRCFLFASIPHAISAFVKVVKWLRTALRPTGVIVFISVRVGTRPSFCASPWISTIISSLLIAFSPIKARVAQPPGCGVVGLDLDWEFFVLSRGSAKYSIAKYQRPKLRLAASS